MPKQQSALSPNLSLKRIVRKPAVRSKGGIVVTQHRIASEIGARVLKEGGNAIDAAIAAYRDGGADAALAAAVDVAHPKARRAVRAALGQYQTAEAGQLLADLLKAGDASYFVEAETALALGKTRAAAAFDGLVAALDRSGWNETVRVGVLDGLAALQDPRAGCACTRSEAPRRGPQASSEFACRERCQKLTTTVRGGPMDP